MALRILIVLLILAVPLELPGCGPFLPVAMFHLPGWPEAPEDFARGQLGVILPSYERLYQVIAYRYLSGVGLNGEEQKAVLPPPPKDALPSTPSMDTPGAPNDWLSARSEVAGVTPVKDIDVYRQVKKDGYFDTYLNCNDDAFSTAASTLKRVKSKPFAADWIAAQDMVFSNCSQGANVPQPASDPQLRPERAYQIASAKFYSEQYDAAHQDFQASRVTLLLRGTKSRPIWPRAAASAPASSIKLQGNCDTSPQTPRVRDGMRPPPDYWDMLACVYIPPNACTNWRWRWCGPMRNLPLGRILSTTGCYSIGP